MPQTTPQQRLAKAVGRRGFMPAFITSVGVFAAVVVQGFLSALLSAAYTTGSLGTAFAGADDAWNVQLGIAITGSLPFAIGVLLCLWQLAPIGPELRLAHVVTRALLAAAAGTLLTVVVVMIVSLITAVAGIPSVFGGDQDLGGVLDDFGHGVLRGVLGALQALVNLAATVVLAAVLLWGWLQRRPREHPVTGSLDEV